jgi:hypothetical protein
LVVFSFILSIYLSLFLSICGYEYKFVSHSYLRAKHLVATLLDLPLLFYSYPFFYFYLSGYMLYATYLYSLSLFFSFYFGMMFIFLSPKILPNKYIFPLFKRYQKELL